MDNEILIKNNDLDKAIEDIIDIFNNVPGVELIRLSGLTKRFSKLSNNPTVSTETVHNIIQKLKSNSIINYQYIMNCPYCHETSYQIIDRDIKISKLCDTCRSLYTLIDGNTLIKAEGK